MKRFVMALALACFLSASTLAGDMSTSGGFVPPPPQGTAQSSSATSPGDIPSVPGDIHTGDFAEQIDNGTTAIVLMIFSLFAR